MVSYAIESVRRLLNEDEEVLMVQLHWDAVSFMALDLALVLALSSIVVNPFMGGGNSMDCIPVNKSTPLVDPGFINQACARTWSRYLAYFPFVLLFQAGILIIIHRSWSRIGDNCLADLCELVHNASARSFRRRHVRDLSRCLASRESDETLFLKLGLKDCLTVSACEDALILSERVIAFFHVSDPTSGRTPYLTKCMFSIFFGVACALWGFYPLVILRRFEFKYGCSLLGPRDLTMYHPNHEFGYNCVIKSATLSYLIQSLFLIVLLVVVLCNMLCLVTWFRYHYHTGNSTSPILALKEDEDEEKDRPHFRILNSHFLFFLLKEANLEMGTCLATFSLKSFHEELEVLQANLKWPVENLKAEIVDQNASSAMLVMTRRDIAYLPISLKRFVVDKQIRIAKADFSFSRRLKSLVNVEHLVHLKSLKCRGCRLDSAGVAPVAKLRCLEFLDVSSNDIRKLPAEMVELKALKWLWIDSNEIEFGDLVHQMESLVEICVESARGEKLKPLFEEVGSDCFHKTQMLRPEKADFWTRCSGSNGAVAGNGHVAA